MSKISADILRAKTAAIEIDMKYPVRGTTKAFAFVFYTGGTPALSKSLNVASLTDVGTGVVGVNLTSAMADTLYLGSASPIVNSETVLWGAGEIYTSRSTSAFRAFSGYLNSTTWTLTDYASAPMLFGDLA